jgi:hypothetical protein
MSSDTDANDINCQFVKARFASVPKAYGVKQTVLVGLSSFGRLRVACDMRVPTVRSALEEAHLSCIVLSEIGVLHVKKLGR